MAYVPAISGASKRIKRALRQNQAVTGDFLRPGELEEIVRGELGAEASVGLQRAQFAEQKRQFDVSQRMQEQALAKEERASAIRGGVELGALGYNLAYLQPKQLKILEQDLAAKRQLLGIQTGAIPGGGVLPATAPTAGLEESIVAGQSISAPAETSTGLSGTSAAGLAKTAGMIGLGSALGGGLARAAGAGRVGRRNTSAAGGATAGMIAAGPVGAVIGAGIGFVSEDTVICKELCRRGYISKRILAADREYSSWYIDNLTYSGYRIWADPIVKLMKKSALVSWLIAPFGEAWARTMGNRMDPHIQVTWLQKFVGHALLYVGVPFSRMVFRIKGRRVRYA